MIEQIVKLIVEFWKFFQFWTVLDAEMIGFVRRLGQPHRDLAPGLNWHIPFRVEVPETVDARVSACICDPQSLRAVDGVTLLLRLKISYCVVDARKYFLNVFEPGNNIQDVASGELGALVRHLPAQAIYDGAALADVTKRIRSQGRKWGLKIFDVEFVDYAPTRCLRLVNSTFTSSGQE